MTTTLILVLAAALASALFVTIIRSVRVGDWVAHRPVASALACCLLPGVMVGTAVFAVGSAFGAL